MFHSSYIEISKTALQNNINFIRNEIGPRVRFSSVVKGNAYGHGIEQFATLAQECGVDHFSVFSADEALRLHQSLPRPATTLIMGYIDDPELEWAIRNDIEFFVFEPDRLTKAADVARKLGKKAKIHLELETGMNRTGFDKTTSAQARKILDDTEEHVTLMAVCTHFAGAENFQNHERIIMQQQNFQELLQQLINSSHTPKQLHSACSAAMVSYPETHMDMVRIGIMQYGFWPSPETYSHYFSQHTLKKDPLRRLINWKSRIMSIKSISKGEYVGYGSSYQTQRDMTLAVIPVGYGWGYSRTLSNQGNVLIRGVRAAVVGIVNMNVMMVDVTDIPAVQKDDEVVLLGSQGDESITVASFAELSTQLNYELLTRLPANIPRLVID
ncbi:alanine racemase [Pontibacter pudoricolor]|uniref:alanine racemase n=1 Tax=Pontibacter pudoricolor TaxID=2694930 RepID=UPI001390E887|nr:alanine racemase [Pontibacter pudoricolor]